jgi:hypothetical protein
MVYHNGGVKDICRMVNEGLCNESLITFKQLTAKAAVWKRNND